MFAQKAKKGVISVKGVSLKGLAWLLKWRWKSMSTFLHEYALTASSMHISEPKRECSHRIFSSYYVNPGMKSMCHWLHRKLWVPHHSLRMAVSMIETTCREQYRSYRVLYLHDLGTGADVEDCFTLRPWPKLSSRGTIPPFRMSCGTSPKIPLENQWTFRDMWRFPRLRKVFHRIV